MGETIGVEYSNELLNLWLPVCVNDRPLELGGSNEEYQSTTFKLPDLILSDSQASSQRGNLPIRSSGTSFLASGLLSPVHSGPPPQRGNLSLRHHEYKESVSKFHPSA